MILCALSPIYRCTTVEYSTRDWNLSLPRIAAIVSIRKLETRPAIRAKTRNTIVGLYKKCQLFARVFAKRKTHSNQPASWKRSGTCSRVSTILQRSGPWVDQLVVNPGPVIELMRSDIPPMNPMPGDGGGSIVEMNEPAIAGAGAGWIVVVVRFVGDAGRKNLKKFIFSLVDLLNHGRVIHVMITGL
jgi:hypothetical protein